MCHTPTSPLLTHIKALVEKERTVDLFCNAPALTCLRSLRLCQPRGKEPQEMAKSWDQETAAWHGVCERTVEHVLLWQGDDKPLGPQEALILNELWMGLMDYLSQRKEEWIWVLEDQGHKGEESTINSARNLIIQTSIPGKTVLIMLYKWAFLTCPSPTVCVSMMVTTPGWWGLRRVPLWAVPSSSGSPDGTVPASWVTTLPTMVRPVFNVWQEDRDTTLEIEIKML